MAGVRVRRRRDEDGAAAVEFALVLIPLVLILFGIISYAYMFSVRQALTQAAAEGARAAAVAQTNPEGAAKAAVDNALDGFGGLKCDNGKLTCTFVPDPACRTGATCVKVSVSLNYGNNGGYDPFNLPLIPMPGTLAFSSSAEVN
ncbi:TadE/TadG family type IV pilus assembly protein [Nocardioides alcanivorans]|uniref:TadE/TadG family type IV pilus assembly protein n=1 Tax=Nocardioides alcanivorans TaxID=2897352 RepID=UPI001F210A70|nr:TadE/TadG family type IV pilus assembly protein [Nocardioides alcanivorans]